MLGIYNIHFFITFLDSVSLKMVNINFSSTPMATAAKNIMKWKMTSCLFLGFMWRHKFHWGSTPNRYTVIRLKKIFIICVDLVFGSKCVQFREIWLLQCSTIINTFWVDPHSELLKKVPVKPKNKTSLFLKNAACQQFFSWSHSLQPER